MSKASLRGGSIHVAWLAFLGSAGLLVVLFGLLHVLGNTGTKHGATGPLVVYCAAGIKQQVQAVADQYEKECGVIVQVQPGPSQTQLASIKASGVGDLYVPADEQYIDMARKDKLVAEAIPIGQMMPVVAVAKGNPKKVKSLDDLLKGNLRISQANPDAAAIGKMTRDALQPIGRWEALKKRTEVIKFTVEEVATDIQVGAVDAGIVWDVTVKQTPGLEAIAIPELAGRSAQVMVGVLTTSDQPTEALRFARYLAARDRGLMEFDRSGFQVAEGDAWEMKPELTFFAGAMLEPVLKPLLKKFEEREGVRVICIYDGCGILVSQMEAGARPDTFMACEKSFMKVKLVSDLFPDPQDISSNQLVIVVHKGNPKQITTLKDLGKRGVRVGVGHEQQCALGVITGQAIDQKGLRQPIMKNVEAVSTSAAELVNQLRVGSLDAVVAYISSTYGFNDIEAFTIEGIPCAIAVQPFAVNKGSKHKQLAARLLDAIKSQESQQLFKEYGFGWKEGQ